MASDWPLLTGGRYLEVAVSSGLTVPEKYFWKIIDQPPLSNIIYLSMLVIKFSSSVSKFVINLFVFVL
jgi:hypothetical protein